MKDKLIVNGCEAAVLGALEGGAETMFGYPITPASGVLEEWIKRSNSNKNLKYLQTEDETSAGFSVCGALLSGTKAFTATAGPGHVLMQDPVSMAENIRLPFVGIIMQRGGPSTGTINFSQQEVNLASFGGNGEGLRIVYSASSVEDMYTLTAKAFSSAWKYRFPTFVLGDGYLAKMKTAMTPKKLVRSVSSSRILKEETQPSLIRNCYSSEEELGKILAKNIYHWNKNASKIAEHEQYQTKDADTLIIAHGLVSSACREAVDLLRSKGKKVGLFRAITVNPLDSKPLIQLAKKVKKIHIFESSRNQFSTIIKYNLYGINTVIYEHPKPAEGFSADEITKLL